MLNSQADHGIFLRGRMAMWANEDPNLGCFSWLKKNQPMLEQLFKSQRTYGSEQHRGNRTVSKHVWAMNHAEGSQCSEDNPESRRHSHEMSNKEEILSPGDHSNSTESESQEDEQGPREHWRNGPRAWRGSEGRVLCGTLLGTISGIPLRWYTLGTKGR